MKSLSPGALALCLCLAAFAVPAAASAQASDTAAAPRREEPRRRDRDRLSTEEIRAAQQSNMYDLIRTLRPRWLRERGNVDGAGSNAVRVYMDGMSQGGPEILRDLDPRHVTGAQYLSAQDATTQFGTDHTRGAILLSTRTQTR